MGVFDFNLTFSGFQPSLILFFCFFFLNYFIFHCRLQLLENGFLWV